MKKTTLIMIIAIFMMFSKPVFASESNDSAEIVFKTMNNVIYKAKSITSEVIDYSVEIVKNWPESRYSGEIINVFRYSPIYHLTTKGIEFKVIQRNSRWFEKNILNDNTCEVETAEIIVYANMLAEPEYFTDYNQNISDYFSTTIHNPTGTYEKPAPRKHYKLDFVKKESIKTLKYIENFSKNENYKILAFFALLEHYCSTDTGTVHIKQFISNHQNHPTLAEIRLYFSNHLFYKNQFEEGINEIIKVIELYKNIIVPLKNFNYGVICYSKLAYLYFEKKDYINAKKYILLLKENAPSTFNDLNDLDNKLQYIEKLIKK